MSVGYAYFSALAETSLGDALQLRRYFMQVLNPYSLFIYFLGFAGFGGLFPAGPPGLPGFVLGLGNSVIGFLGIVVCFIDRTI